MIGEQGEDSCGKSRLDETPQARHRRGGSYVARGKLDLLCKSIVVSHVINTSSLIHFVCCGVSGLKGCFIFFFYFFVGSC
ncbi:hypothetical protein C1Y47_14420 [Priestia megaterium]|nr:hypothetical protein [Priestia megaterium]PNE06473.1 hypothetical protein C1Y47_14420 [Priestia megaterium]